MTKFVSSVVGSSTTFLLNIANLSVFKPSVFFLGQTCNSGYHSDGCREAELRTVVPDCRFLETRQQSSRERAPGQTGHYGSREKKETREIIRPRRQNAEGLRPRVY